MSQGRDTQEKINIWLWLTIAAALAQVSSLIILQTTRNPIVWILLGVVIVIATIGTFAHRCPECRHDVTKDAEGVRAHKGWPKVNETCANCGAELP
jgi:hypothetical protein